MPFDQPTSIGDNMSCTYAYTHIHVYVEPSETYMCMCMYMYMYIGPCNAHICQAMPFTCVLWSVSHVHTHAPMYMYMSECSHASCCLVTSKK